MTPNYVRLAPSCFCVTAFCAALLCAAPVGSQARLDPSTSVTAVVFPDGHYSKVAIREMGREASHILNQSGVSLHWRVGAPSQSVSGLLVVVKLRGNCDMDGSPAFLEPGPLGWAHEVNGTVLPFSDLACNNLRGAVESAIAEGNPLRGNILLGRAMGRVLAHEVYHIVADTSTHGKDGVAQAALSPRELTSGPLEFDHPQTEAMQSGLSRGR